MARKPSPWWWEEERGWYVNHNGKRHFLGKHPENASRPKKSEKTGRWNAPKEIEQAFRLLLSHESEFYGAGGQNDPLVQVLDDFIAWSQENKAQRTTMGYRRFCQDFVNVKGEDAASFGTIPAIKITGKHIQVWLNQRPTWGPSTKRNAITAIVAALNWAVRNRGLERNPLHGIRKPEAKRRKSTVSLDEFEKILAIATGPFSDLITVSYDSGARPFELKDLESRHVDLAKRRAVIPADEAKGRKYTRVLYFATDRSLAIVERLIQSHPSGPIFRNNRGNQWTGDAVKCSFARLEKILGKRLCHYDFRRTYITRKIVSGVDSHIVAKLAGHQSTAMIDRHYSAVGEDHDFMLRMAGIGNGGGIVTGSQANPDYGN